jgi:hypothetical protein
MRCSLEGFLATGLVLGSQGGGLEGRLYLASRGEYLAPLRDRGSIIAHILDRNFRHMDGLLSLRISNGNHSTPERHGTPSKQYLRRGR